ncbi:hypothetical protein BUALT_Bualt05G0005700 [Buddleja alternifolia]|uniref:Homeobox domain-containing protein n=1 Tax=Buddleja alternifolia TaxID=168488 RepID=A0AAV6XND3_9LAMI|nr:hypothetical protein BUALT_Bualt05G0005700 [Buddleja alternifolia]
MASTTLRISITLKCGISNKEPLFVGNPISSNFTNSFLPRRPPPHATVLSFARRRRETATSSVTSKKLNKKKVTQKNVEKEDDIDEDAFEALFRQLEEDLKNDGNGDGDDDISEEELAKLEQELAEALEDDELLGALVSLAGGETKNEDDDDEEEEDEDENGDGDEVDDENEEEEWSTKLKNWQLKRLAYALRNGRRKTSIKNLAAELCLDRAVVLKLLRDPPPSLVMLSAALPDKPVSPILDPVEELAETVPSETVTHEVEAKVPVHVMQSNWTARKRIKKVQLETLEQVYKRTKRPTNAMISSIVHVTNLPRKKVVKWFEDKRGEDGVPQNRLPYQRPTPDSVFTS